MCLERERHGEREEAKRSTGRDGSYKEVESCQCPEFSFYQNEYPGVDYLGITKISLVCLYLRSYMFASFLLLSLLTLKQQVENEAEEASVLMEPTSSHLLFFGSSLR